jgi:hypothetical protein
VTTTRNTILSSWTRPGAIIVHAPGAARRYSAWSLQAPRSLERRIYDSFRRAAQSSCVSHNKWICGSDCLYKMRGDAVAYMVTTCYGARPDLSSRTSADAYRTW